MKKILLCLIILLSSCSFGYAQGCGSDEVFLTHCNGTDESTTFTDENCDSSGAHTITAEATAQVDTAVVQSGWGTGSLLVDGNSDYLSIPDSADFTLSATGTWTIEAWTYASTYTGGLIGTATGTTDGWDIRIESSYARLQWGNGSTISVDIDAGTLTTSQWNHLVYNCDGTNVSAYVNGTRTDTGTTLTGTSNGGAMYIGSGYGVSTGNWNTMTQWFTGNIDEVRISDADKYDASSSSLTVPTEEYSVDSSRNRMIVLRKKFIKLPSGGYRREVSTQNFAWEGLI